MNSHAGERGAFGGEEREIIAPAIEQGPETRASRVDEPFGADILLQRTGYEFMS